MKKRNKNIHIKRNFKKRLGIKMIALGMVLIGLFIMVDLRIRPIIEKSSTYQCQVLASRIINETVYNELKNSEYDYNSLIKITSDENGMVKSIESDMIKINSLKAHSTLLINEAIQQISINELGIALGTVSGVNMLYGQGPQIPIKIAPKGYAKADLISKFTSAGINQTLHQIIMKITVDITAIIPGYTKSMEISSDYIIAETIVIGNIPSSYTHVITGDSDLLSKINDYGIVN